MYPGDLVRLQPKTETGKATVKDDGRIWKCLRNHGNHRVGALLESLRTGNRRWNSEYDADLEAYCLPRQQQYRIILLQHNRNFFEIAAFNGPDLHEYDEELIEAVAHRAFLEGKIEVGYYDVMLYDGTKLVHSEHKVA